jgi:hypothetical protein
MLLLQGVVIAVSPDAASLASRRGHCLQALMQWVATYGA